MARGARSVWEAFAARVAAAPDNLAVTDGTESVTYAELAELARTIATVLPEGARFCGIVCRHGISQVAAILAALSRGCAYVPVERDFPPARTDFILAEPPVDVVLTDHASDGALGRWPHIYLDDLQSHPTAAPAAAPSTAPASAPATASRGRTGERSADDDQPLAYVLYTSGSTGRPKGVCVTGANVLGYARAFAAEFHPTVGDVMLQQSVCTFDIFVEEVFGALLNGAALAIAPREATDDAAALLAFMDRTGVTIASGFPHLMADIACQGWLPSSVRLLISGGDVLRASQVEGLLDRVTLYNTYGPSETTVCATYCRVNGRAPYEDGTFPIGHPILGVGVVLVDEDGSPVAAGEPGEICISGAGVAAGYLDTSIVGGFGTNAAGEPQFRSGDLGSWDEHGTLRFLGRKDDQIMIGGRRVEPAEVENVICTHPGVVAAVVRGTLDEDGNPMLVAYVEPAPDAGDLALREFLSRSLPPYMLPAETHLVPRIPLTANGKPDLAALTGCADLAAPDSSEGTPR